MTDREPEPEEDPSYAVMNVRENEVVITFDTHTMMFNTARMSIELIDNCEGDPTKALVGIMDGVDAKVAMKLLAELLNKVS